MRKQVPTAGISAVKRSGYMISFLPLRNSTSGRWRPSHLCSQPCQVDSKRVANISISGASTASKCRQDASRRPCPALSSPQRCDNCFSLHATSPAVRMTVHSLQVCSRGEDCLPGLHLAQLYASGCQRPAIRRVEQAAVGVTTLLLHLNLQGLRPSQPPTKWPSAAFYAPMCDAR